MPRLVGLELKAAAEAAKIDSPCLSNEEEQLFGVLEEMTRAGRGFLSGETGSAEDAAELRGSSWRSKSSVQRLFTGRSLSLSAGLSKMSSCSMFTTSSRESKRKV